RRRGRVDRSGGMFRRRLLFRHSDITPLGRCVSARGTRAATPHADLRSSFPRPGGAGAVATPAAEAMPRAIDQAVLHHVFCVPLCQRILATGAAAPLWL